MSYNDDNQRSGGYGRDDDNLGSRRQEGGYGGDNLGSSGRRGDTFGSSGREGGLGSDDNYGSRTSGGLGKDDTFGDSSRTGGTSYGRDDEQGLGSGRTAGGLGSDDNYRSSERSGGYGTSGGLGSDDTFGGSTQTGGRSTGRDNEYGLGSGRTEDQARGGFGESDDTYRSTGRSGASEYTSRGDYDTSGRTGGGLGVDDTYGDSSKTGGDSTGRDDEYGMGSGRTRQQEHGGIGGEPGRGFDDNDNDKSGGKKDSTMGKLMQKAGDMFNNDKLEERGAEKRGGSGGYGGSNY